MAITYRLVKGSELTHVELDGNFTELDARDRVVFHHASVTGSYDIPDVNRKYLIGGASGVVVTIKLPANPAIGDTVSLHHGSPNWGDETGMDFTVTVADARDGEHIIWHGSAQQGGMSQPADEADLKKGKYSVYVFDTSQTTPGEGQPTGIWHALKDGYSDEQVGSGASE